MSIATLVIEDNPSISDHLVIALHELTDVHVMAVAQTPVQALALVDKNGTYWELMILDLFLKEGTGLSVLQACRDRLAHQCIVVFTSMATPEMRQKCLELGANAVFDKSSESAELFDFCNRYRAFEVTPALACN
jgi:DNA-binding NarL/FixJ family response regulator